jgi:hypothetical protein
MYKSQKKVLQVLLVWLSGTYAVAVFHFAVADPYFAVAKPFFSDQKCCKIRPQQQPQHQKMTK